VTTDNPHGNRSDRSADAEEHRRAQDSAMAEIRSGVEEIGLKMAAEVAGILSLVVAVVAIFIQTADLPGPGPVTPPAAEPNRESPPPPFDQTLFDDFSGSEINQANWRIDNDNRRPWTTSGSPTPRTTSHSSRRCARRAERNADSRAWA